MYLVQLRIAPKTPKPLYYLLKIKYLNNANKFKSMQTKNPN